jgi:hypothetical protein
VSVASFDGIATPALDGPIRQTASLNLAPKAEGQRDNSLMSLVAVCRGTPHSSYDIFARKNTLV